MSKQDMENFIKKVDSLNKLLDSLNHYPKRADELSSCQTHDEVVELARTWGYEIGRRWGE